MMKRLTKNRTTIAMALLVLCGLLFTTAMALAGDKEAFETAKVSAFHGDAEAQYQLGLMYATGRGVRQDLSQAAAWYKKAAVQGNAEAQYQVGTMYDTGKGMPQNFTEAVSWYNKAAEQGHKAAQLNAEKIQQHLDSLQNSAEKGVASDQVTLGKMYTAGNGVPQDDAKAVAWYKKAAEQGFAEGQCQLGFSYAESKGVDKDYNQAVAWYRKAAEQGLAEAQYKLAGMYHRGRGVPQSGVNAYAWLTLAAAQGYDPAASNQGFAISKLTPEQQSQAKTLAAELQAMIDSKKP